LTPVPYGPLAQRFFADGAWHVASAIPHFELAGAEFRSADTSLGTVQMQTRRIKRIISCRDWPRLKRREQWNRAMALLANHDPKPLRGRSHALVFSLLKNAKGLVGVWVHPVGRGFEFSDILGQLSRDLPPASVGVVFRQLTIYLCLSSVLGRVARGHPSRRACAPNTQGASAT
jgi:hypothetical protein